MTMSSSRIADPETDPTATFAVDPAVARRLLRRVVAGPGATRCARAPFTGSPIAVLPMSTADDVGVAAQRARAAQHEWSRRPLTARARPFLALHDLVLDHQHELLDLIQIESGKARAHAFEEVADVAIVARHYARRASSYLRPRRRQGAFPLLSSAHELRHPKGVVGIIAPWNYPLSLAVTDAIPALIAGNAVVLKPDTQTVLTALRVLELLTEAGVPEGLVQVVVGDGAVVGTAIVDTADYVCFTGSTATGRLVAEQAGRRLVGASLELGGKNALYVAADADLERAAEGAVRACFASAGQLCVSAERMLLHDDIADAFLDLFLARVRGIRLGTALDYSADCGSRRQASIRPSPPYGRTSGTRARPSRWFRRRTPQARSSSSTCFIGAGEISSSSAISSRMAAPFRSSTDRPKWWRAWSMLDDGGGRSQASRRLCPEKLRVSRAEFAIRTSGACRTI